MVLVENMKAYGILDALRGMRNPLNSWDKNDSTCKCDPNDGHVVELNLGPNDMKLCKALTIGGPPHRKFLRQIPVTMDITAPMYWWAEMDTYRIGTERLSSESTMHIQGRALPTEELVKMKEELPEGTMQKRIQYFSYQTLRRIYKQRRCHRLPHWHIFCDWIKSLPFAEQLILVGLNENKDM
jgi:hypothetical protein